MTAPAQGAHLLQRPEPLRLAAFERGQFVDHQRVEVPVMILHQPRHVLPVDDVQHRLFVQRRPPLFLRAQHQRVRQPLEMVPLGDLGGPGILRHALGRNDQHAPGVKAVHEQFPQRRQRDDALAETHVEDQPTAGMFQNEIRRKPLIIMRDSISCSTPPICSTPSMTNTLNPRRSSRSLRRRCKGRSFCPGAFSSTKPILPPGRSTIAVGHAIPAGGYKFRAEAARFPNGLHQSLFNRALEHTCDPPFVASPFCSRCVLSPVLRE